MIDYFLLSRVPKKFRIEIFAFELLFVCWICSRVSQHCESMSAIFILRGGGGGGRGGEGREEGGGRVEEEGRGGEVEI